MLIFVDDEFHIHIVPARECARGLTDILFRVVADSHGEQLHDFAREILVGSALDVDARVEEREHGGVLRHGDRKIPKVAGSLLLKQLQLIEKLAVIANLGFVRNKMAVPEQRHFLLQRPGAVQHPVRPPVSDTVGFERAGAQPVKEFIDDGLQTAVAAGFDLDSQRFALSLWPGP